MRKNIVGATIPAFSIGTFANFMADCTNPISDSNASDLNERDYRALLASLPDAMLIVGDDGKIVIANQQASLMFGYGENELSGQPIEMLIPERYRGRHAASRAGYTATPHVRPMGVGLELFGLRKDGTEFPVEISLSRLACNSCE